MAGKRTGKAKTSYSTVPFSNNSNQLPTNNHVGSRTRTLDDLQTLTKEQLKVECRKRGQKTSGTKNELVRRLHGV